MKSQFALMDAIRVRPEWHGVKAIDRLTATVSLGKGKVGVGDHAVEENGARFTRQPPRKQNTPFLVGDRSFYDKAACFRAIRVCSSNSTFPKSMRRFVPDAVAFQPNAAGAPLVRVGMIAAVVRGCPPRANLGRRGRIRG